MSLADYPPAKPGQVDDNHGERAPFVGETLSSPTRIRGLPIRRICSDPAKKNGPAQGGAVGVPRGSWRQFVFNRFCCQNRMTAALK